MSLAGNLSLYLTSIETSQVSQRTNQARQLRLADVPESLAASSSASAGQLDSMHVERSAGTRRTALGRPLHQRPNGQLSPRSPIRELTELSDAELNRADENLVERGRRRSVTSVAFAGLQSHAGILAPGIEGLPGKWAQIAEAPEFYVRPDFYTYRMSSFSSWIPNPWEDIPVAEWDPVVRHLALAVSRDDVHHINRSGVISWSKQMGYRRLEHQSILGYVMPDFLQSIAQSKLGYLIYGDERGLVVVCDTVTGKGCYGWLNQLVAHFYANKARGAGEHEIGSYFKRLSQSELQRQTSVTHAIWAHQTRALDTDGANRIVCRLNRRIEGFLGDSSGRVLKFSVRMRSSQPGLKLKIVAVGASLYDEPEAICSMALDVDETHLAVADGRDNVNIWRHYAHFDTTKNHQPPEKYPPMAQVPWYSHGLGPGGAQCYAPRARNFLDPKVFLSTAQESYSPLQLERELRQGSAVRGMAFCPALPSMLVTGGGRFDRQVRIFDLTSREAVGAISMQAQVTGVTFVSKYEVFVALGHSRKNSFRGLGKVINVLNGRIVAEIPSEGEYMLTLLKTETGFCANTNRSELRVYTWTPGKSELNSSEAKAAHALTVPVARLR